jgi:hypothetical protein
VRAIRRRTRAPEDLATGPWAAQERGDTPTAIRGLLARRTRVELTEQEAQGALAWASRLAGWDAPVVESVFRYP